MPGSPATTVREAAVWVAYVVPMMLVSFRPLRTTSKQRRRVDASVA
jgi:hypothetical protein